MPILSSNTDPFLWTGSSGGQWGLAGNWRDTMLGGNPAGTVPGGLTQVSIAGPAGLTYEVIGGGGTFAGLTVTGNVALGGAYGSGAVAVGTRTAVGGGSASVSYIYAAGALTITNSLTTSSLTLANGSLKLGTGAALSSSGPISIGTQSAISGGTQASYDPGAAASLSLANGAQFTSIGPMTLTQGSVAISGTLTIASTLMEIVGSISVSGAGSRLSVQQQLTLGLTAPSSLGSFSLGVTNGGAVTAGGLAIQAPAGGDPAATPPSLYVDAGSSIDIGTGTAAAGTLTIEAGRSVAAGTNATITAAIVDNGILSATGGNLTVAGNLSGTGTVRIGRNGTVTLNGTVAATDTLAFTDATAILAIGTNPSTGLPYSVAATVSGFQLGNIIQVTAPVTGLSYAQTNASLGILSLLNGTSTIATLALAGSYATNNFVLAPAIGGGGDVFLIAPQTGSGGTAAANGNSYNWIGSTGGYWGVTTNWQDLTTASNPAQFIPGSLNPVTIAGPAGSFYEVIRGGGRSASLGITGNVDLNDLFTTGILSIGTRNVTSAGTIYAAGSLMIAKIVAAGTVQITSGSLVLAGIGSTLATSGPITIGTQSLGGNGTSAGYDPGASASLNVAAGTSLNSAGTLTLTQGSITIRGADAKMSVSDTLTEILGSIQVDGTGSRLSVTNQIILGLAANVDSSSYSLAVTNGGSVQAGSLTIQAPAAGNAGTALSTTPFLFVDASSSMEIGSGTATAGTLTVDAGSIFAIRTDATVNAAIVDNGTLSIVGGTMTLAGNLTGTGELQIGRNGSVTVNGTIAASNRIVFTDTSATLAIGSNPTGTPFNISAAISGFQQGNNILLSAAASAINYVATGTNLGTLTVLNGGTSLTSLIFAGSYLPSLFFLSPTISGGSNISLLTQQTGNGDAKATSAGTYSWTGSSGGQWGLAGNWRDTMLGGNPAGTVPGGLTQVSIAGPAGLTYEVIGGGGTFAGLTVTGNVALGGAYGSGAVAVGTRTAVGGGSASVSYIYAAGALTITNSLTTSSLTLANGSLKLGTGAALSSSGPISIGTQSAISGGTQASYDPGAAASLSLANGAQFTSIGPMTLTQGSVAISGTLTIASTLMEIVGSISVSGAGSRLSVQQQLTLGLTAPSSLGSFSLGVTNGGAVTAGGLAIQAPAGGDPAATPPSLYVDAGSSIDIGTGTAAAGTLTIEAGRSVAAGTNATITAAIVDNGILSATGGNLTVAGNLSGTGTVRIGRNGTVTLNGTVAATDTLAFTDATAILAIGTNPSTGLPYSVAATVSGFQLGNIIQVTAPVTGLSYTQTNASIGILSLLNGISTIATLALAGSYATSNFVLAPAIGGGESISWQTLPIGPAASDFNGDGKSDILWQNDNGTPAIWLMNGTSYVTGATLANPGPTWHIKASGDFNGDGKSDILWQNDNGTPAIWLMNGTSYVSGATLSNPGTSWHIKATGDFNGDGKSDILWQNDNGTPAIWLMNGTSYVTGATLTNPGASWHIEGTGDFNGDGKSDILWQNNNGAPAIWLMNGTSYVTGATLTNPGTSWHIEGTGDFNGDGKSDILWQNNNGAPAIWLMNGTSYVTGVTLTNPGTSWHVKGTGDFNGDGKSDIFWQNDNGTPAIWLMNGTSYVTGATLTNPGTSWHMIGSDGMIFISGATGNGTLAASPGQDETFVFTTYATGAHTISGFDPAHDLIELSLAKFANFAAVQAHSTASGGGTLIALDGSSSLTIQGVAPGSLTANDFRFV